MKRLTTVFFGIVLATFFFGPLASCQKQCKTVLVGLEDVDGDGVIDSLFEERCPDIFGGGTTYPGGGTGGGTGGTIVLDPTTGLPTWVIRQFQTGQITVVGRPSISMNNAIPASQTVTNQGQQPQTLDKISLNVYDEATGTTYALTASCERNVMTSWISTHHLRNPTYDKNGVPLKNSGGTMCQMNISYDGDPVAYTKLNNAAIYAHIDGINAVQQFN